MNDYDKIFILGLDGLEYDFVEKWNMVHLAQRDYSKITVPLSEKTGTPTSPEVWASFLTGKHVQMSFDAISPPLAPLLNLLGFMRKYINLSLGLNRKIRENVPMKMWKHWHTGFPPLKQKTFLDLTNSKEINAPYYSYDDVAFTVMRNFGDGKLSLRQSIGILKALYGKSKNRILRETESFQDADVVFAYMHFPDILQHLLFVRPSEIKKHYIDLDNYASVLKSRIKDSTLFIIVSDHGFSFGTKLHSKHAFYSSNVILEPKPKRITDFFQIIKTISRQVRVQ